MAAKEYDLITKLHPIQQKNSLIYKFLIDSYTGKGGYDHSLDLKDNSLQGRANSQLLYGVREITYLDRYCAEDISDYYDRLTTSEYYNYTKPVIDLYNNFLFRRHIMRSSSNSILLNWIEQSNIDSIIIEIEKVAAIYGFCGVLVDLPSVDESVKNLKQAIDQGYKGPELSIIDPTRIVNWGIKDDGSLKWIRYVTHKTISNPFTESEVLEYYTTWTDSEYYIHLIKDKQEVELVKQGANPFNKVPVAIFKFAESYENEIVGESQAFEIATLNKAHYNRKSELTNLLRGQAFSQLVIPSNEVNRPEIKTGIGSVIYVPPESTTKAEYISPNAQNATILANEVSNIEENIMRVSSLEWLRSMMNGRSATVMNSGISRKFSFSQCNSKLKNIAKRLETFEYELMNLVCLGFSENLDNSYSIEYPKNFELDAMTNDFKDLFAAIIGGLPKSAIDSMRIRLAEEMIQPTEEQRLIYENEVKNNPAIINQVEMMPIEPMNNQA